MHTVTTQQRDEDLRYHLEHEHKHSPFADYFKEVIYGGIDGIVTTFAVVAGFSGAALSNETTTQLSFLVVLLFGVANLFADGVSMGLGNFLSIRSEKDLYGSARGKELNEIRVNPEMEYEETITIMIQKGFSQEEATKLADIYRTNEEYWADFMMNHELEMPDVREENEYFSGLATFGSFLAFGVIPLIPFLIMSEGTASEAFVYSVIGTVVGLVLLGVLKWKVTGSQLGTSLFEVVIVGGSAALVAFFVGTLFEV